MRHGEAYCPHCTAILISSADLWGLMAYRVTLGEFSCDLLRRSARSGIATKISLLILLASATNGYALSGMFSGAPLTQQPVNASGAISQEGVDAQALEPGKPIERELAGGGSHSYQLR